MILTYLLSVYSDNQRTKNTQRLLETAYHNFLNLDNNNRLQTGDYLTLFQKDVDQIAGYYSSNLPLIIQSIVGLICYSIYFICFMKNWVVLCADLVNRPVAVFTTLHYAQIFGEKLYCRGRVGSRINTMGCFGGIRLLHDKDV